MRSEVLDIKKTTKNLVTKRVEIDVGPGYEFQTINEALEHLSRLETEYRKAGVEVEIVLEPGFVMEEQVLVNDKDLSWIKISSRNGITPKTVVAFTQGSQIPGFEQEEVSQVTIANYPVNDTNFASVLNSNYFTAQLPDLSNHYFWYSIPTKARTTFQSVQVTYEENTGVAGNDYSVVVAKDLAARSPSAALVGNDIEVTLATFEFDIPAEAVITSSTNTGTEEEPVYGTVNVSATAAGIYDGTEGNGIQIYFTDSGVDGLTATYDADYEGLGIRAIVIDYGGEATATAAQIATEINGITGFDATAGTAGSFDSADNSGSVGSLTNGFDAGDPDITANTSSAIATLIDGIGLFSAVSTGAAPITQEGTFNLSGGSTGATDPALSGTGHVITLTETDEPTVAATTTGSVIDGVTGFTLNVVEGRRVEFRNTNPGEVENITRTGSFLSVLTLEEGTNIEYQVRVNVINHGYASGERVVIRGHLGTQEERDYNGTYVISDVNNEENSFELKWDENGTTVWDSDFAGVANTAEVLIPVPVIVDRASLTQVWEFFYYPAFGVARGTLPTINAVFEMNTTGSNSYMSYKDGLCATDQGIINVNAQCGFRNAGGSNIYGTRRSSINANDAIADNAGRYGVWAYGNTTINARRARASNCGWAAVENLILENPGFKDGWFSGESVGSGIIATRGSTINADGCIVRNSVGDNIVSEFGSTINVGSHFEEAINEYTDTVDYKRKEFRAKGSFISGSDSNGEPWLDFSGHSQITTPYHIYNGKVTATNLVETNGFATTLYTGNGTTQDVVTNVDMDTQWGDSPNETSGGLVWIKSRSGSGSTYRNRLFDTVRGATNYISSDGTDANATISGMIDSFLSDGFNLGSNSNVNDDSQTYVAWSWQTTHRTTGTTNHGKPYTCHYNPFTGFTIVRYEGSGIAGHEIPHHLGRQIRITYTKRLDAASNWRVFLSDGLSGQLENTNALAQQDWMNLTEEFTVYKDGNLNRNGNAGDYILYGWANAFEDENDTLRGNYEVGIYNGTGAAGNFVETKRKPAYVMIKQIDATRDWLIVDSQREDAYGILVANSSSSESTAERINLVENGFIQISTNTSWNESGGQYLYFVIYDNDDGSGLSTYDRATDTTNLLIDAHVPYAKGIDESGAKSIIQYKNETIVLSNSLSEGNNYIASLEDGIYVAKYSEPFYGKRKNIRDRSYAGEQFDVFDIETNKWYQTTDGGGELVTNGTFETTDGWITGNNTIAIVNNTLQVTRPTDADPFDVYSVVPTVIGKKYRIKVNIGQQSGNFALVSVSDNNDIRLVSFSSSTPTRMDRTFTANTTVTKVYLGVSPSDHTAYFDDVSVFELEPEIDAEITPRNYLDCIVSASNGQPNYAKQLLKTTYFDSLAANSSLSRNGSNVYTREDILGTVSQSGGVPTGAIIERDSNANGEYVKFADGTMICWFEGVIGTQNINEAFNFCFASSAIEWTYPVQFVSVPSVAPGGTSHNLTVSSNESITTTAARTRMLSNHISLSNVNKFGPLAIGRWY